MTVYGTILPGAASIARSAFLAGNLSERAKYRIKVVDWHNSHSRNISLTARHFGLSRETVIIWRNRLATQGPRGLEDRSCRPHQLRKPIVSPDIVSGVVKLRRQYPAWSKYKIQALLAPHLKTSVSTVGRILKRRGLIDARVSRKRARAAKHPKARFPRGLRISSPGDLIQMDTKHIMLIGGRKFYQFTAIDVLSKRKVIRIYSSESSRNGRDFLKCCLEEFPFSIKAVQTDNGAPFLGEFQQFCQELNLPHYFIYPRTPKQNTYVEISIGSDKREFYLQGNVYSDLPVMQRKIEEWQDTWNNIRPHQSLNYLTPNAYLEKWQQGRLPTKDVITLQT
jgi:transposase InsO family protein